MYRKTYNLIKDMKNTKDKIQDIGNKLEILVNNLKSNPILSNFDFQELRNNFQYYVNLARNFTKMAVIVPVGSALLGSGFKFPDKDISILGIANHRFFLFHSAIGVYILKKVYDNYLLHINSTKKKDNISNIVKKAAGTALSGFAAGIGIHLLVDVFQPKSIVFPFIGSLIDGTLIDDNIWLLSNSLYCFKIAKDVFVIAWGDDLEVVKEYVRKNFIEPLMQYHVI